MQISREETLRYLGYRGQAIPDAILQVLDSCEKQLLGSVRVRTTWRVFERDTDGTWKGTAFRPAGQALAQHVQGCTRIVAMAATLGLETERLLGAAQKTDMTRAVVLDAMASAAIESVCDALCDEIARSMAPAQLTSRFSPGYGDFPLEQQIELGRVLDVTRRVGITLSPSGLMFPQKSVTAVLGVLDTFQASSPEHGNRCDACAMRETCAFSRSGATCQRTR